MDIELLSAEMSAFARETYTPIIKQESLAVLLRVLRQYQPQTICEIGSAIGYSCIQMLNAVPEAKLAGTEIRKCRYAQSLAYIERAGFSDRAEMLLMDAAEFLSTTERKFDFVFLDGPKGQYPKYLTLIDRVLNPRGVIFSDNLNFDGRVEMVTKQGLYAIGRKHRAAVKGLIAYRQAIMQPPYLTEFLSDGDGIAITVKDE